MRQLRQIDARIPVLVITVVRSADSAIEAMRQGAYDYLLKPFDVQKLDRVINEALTVAHVMRERVALSRVVAETAPLPTRLCLLYPGGTFLRRRHATSSRGGTQ